MGTCCTSQKAKEEKQNPAAVKSLIESTLNSIDSLISFLQNQTESLEHLPQMEALLLYFGKIRDVLCVELNEMIQNGKTLKPTALKGLTTLNQKIESLKEDLKYAILENVRAEDFRDSVSTQLDNLEISIIAFRLAVQDITDKGLSIFFPDYSENAQGIASTNFANGYDKIVTKLKNTEAELKDKAEGFKSLLAAEFWHKKFGNEDNVEWTSFEPKFSFMTSQIHKKTLNQKELEKLSQELGPKVSKKKLDEFIWNVWDVSFKRRDFSEK